MSLTVGSTTPLVEAVTLSRQDLPRRMAQALAEGYRLVLVAGAQDPEGLRVVHALARPRDDRRLEFTVPVPTDDPWVPSLAGLSYPAGRFDREVRDLFGIVPRDHPLPFRLVRHGHWPTGWYPMRTDAGPPPDFGPDAGSFPFLEVAGPGVYEIPVGPVHAGMIEPGHFRFSVVGETIIRMKARLWYVHRGIEKLFEGRRPGQGIELAERISGDTAVGHTVAFAMAVEQALGLVVSEPERIARAVLLELERLSNHVTDLGAILGDVGFGIVQAHTQRLRESLLRLNATVTGDRLLRGAVTIGGTRLRALPGLGTVAEVAARTAEVVEIALDHPMVLDRLRGTAVLHRADAERLGVLGYVARASGLTTDARRDHPFVDLGPEWEPVTEPDGDVLARFVVRAREVAASAALIALLTERLGPEVIGPLPEALERAEGPGTGLSLVEAWRGTVAQRVELDSAGRLRRVAVVDPSFFTWPALPVALADTIVPDFPLANKSFNQSYAGNDL